MEEQLQEQPAEQNEPNEQVSDGQEITKKKKRINMQKVMLNLQDLFTVLTILALTSYMIFLMVTGAKEPTTLNYCMLGIMIMFFVVFAIKIFVWNKDSNIEESKNMKSSFKVAKYFLNIAMFIVLIEALVSTITSGKSGSFALFISTLTANLFFIVSLAWDTLLFKHSRKKRKIGKQIAQARIKKDISPQELSVKIGRKPNYISKIESGEANSGIKTWEAICKALGIELHDLFSPKNDKSKRH